jgi:hypothetical protein
MNWKQRRTEFFSGTRNVRPRILISTSRSNGRKTSDMVALSPETSASKVTRAVGEWQLLRGRTCPMLQWLSLYLRRASEATSRDEGRRIAREERPISGARTSHVPAGLLGFAILAWIYSTANRPGVKHGPYGCACALLREELAHAAEFFVALG